MAPLRRFVAQFTRVAQRGLTEQMTHKLANNKQFQQFAVKTHDAFERARREVEENGVEHARRLAERTHERGVQPARDFVRALREEWEESVLKKPPRR